MLRFGNKTTFHTFSDSWYMWLYINMLSTMLSGQESPCVYIWVRCSQYILWNLCRFYIKPQRKPDIFEKTYGCVLFYFYIKPQPTIYAERTRRSRVLFYFYIKPQLKLTNYETRSSCVLFYFYIKPQPICEALERVISCVLFYFYIKPQRHWA